MTVEELLQERKIQYKLSPADAIVACLNPEHDDSNPSMRIDRITGVFNCFSCGFKGNLFNHEIIASAGDNLYCIFLSCNSSSTVIALLVHLLRLLLN